MEYIQKLNNEIQYTGWQEWISTLAQIWSVWLARKNNILVFPIGLIGLCLAFYLYFFVADPPLYADASLNLYYIIMSFYGWYIWNKKSNDSEVYPISQLNNNEWIVGIGIFLLTQSGLYYILTLTNSNTPVMDSTVSSSAVLGMWWMTRRKIENWIAYIISNLVAIPLNFYKGFMLFTLMYILFLLLAIYGYMEWKNKIKNI
jgi:nicotinamide mononucleotide transporter